MWLDMPRRHKAFVIASIRTHTEDIEKAKKEAKAEQAKRAGNDGAPHLIAKPRVRKEW